MGLLWCLGFQCRRRRCCCIDRWARIWRYGLLYLMMFEKGQIARAVGLALGARGGATCKALCLEKKSVGGVLLLYDDERSDRTFVFPAGKEGGVSG